MNNESNLIEAAERKIAAMLAELEKDTGMLVESIDIKQIDVTTYRDNTKQLSRSVQLTLKPVPGSHWQV